MINILHAIDTTGPGGAETVFIELLDRLDRTTYTPTVVIRGKGWVHDELCRRGYTPYIVPAKGSFNLRYLFSLVSIIRRKKIDLIQSHLFGSNVYCSLAGWLTRTPVIATFHGSVDVDGERFVSSKFYIINRLASRIILVSEELKARITSLVTLNLRKTSIIYNGVNTTAYNAAKNDALKNRIDFRGDVLIGSLGNVRPAKAYDILIRAAKLVVRTLPDVKFVIAGDNNNALHQTLLELRNKLELDDVVLFLGFCDDTAEFLNGIDVFLLSSTSEGCPVSVIEAMSAGVPLVVTDCGGLLEMVKDDVDALVCPAYSPQALADAIIRLINAPELGAKLVANARETVSSRFTMDAMLNSYEGVYQAALQGR